jgi:hypothetical protein
VAWRVISLIISILLGGITHHYLGSSLAYCNSLNKFGTIYSPYTVVMLGDKEKKLGFIKGKDSACGDIFGPVASFYLSENVDFIAGSYNANFKAFEERGMVPPSVFGITPILGINYKIPITKNIEIANVVSIGIISHSISFSF